MVSIIIPVYNQADKLARCLDSILAQSYADYEVIIVNDGSMDDPQSIIKNYELRITNLKIINQENRGSNPARNRGMKEARGEYLLFCDADIEMSPEMLGEMLSALKNNPEAAYAYSSFKFGSKLFKLFPFEADKLRTMPFIHTTSLIRREFFPGFDENIKRLQDWDLWLTILKQYGKGGAWIDKVLFKVKTGGTISNWLPSIFYKIFPFLPAVKKYKNSVEIIREKHNL